MLIQQAPSNPPTVGFSSHSDGDTVSGTETFTVNTGDDSAVEEVWFYVNGGLVASDDTAPYSYTRVTTNDDNHPSIPIAAVAIDDDDLVSDPAVINVTFKNARPFPVYDDLEDGDGDWTMNNDAPNPDWALIEDSDDAYSGDFSWGWVGPVGGNYNSDWLFYLGFAPTSGRQSIDLSGDDVTEPVLRFMHNSDVPGDCGLRVRAYNTWDGWSTLGWAEENTAGWEPFEFPLENYVGKSIRLRFFMINRTADGGTGFWLDDVRVENKLPTILEISPDRVTVGTEITISGIGFGFTRETSKVTFADGVDAGAGDYTSWSNEEIVLDVPADAESGDLTVTVGDNTSLGYDFTVVLSPPVLDSLEQL